MRALTPGVVAACWVLLGPRSALAGPTAAECAHASEDGQVLQHKGQLIEAHAKYLLCAANSCPGVIREDCVPWAERAGQDIPTIALHVNVNGEEQLAAEIALDGKHVEDHIDVAHGLPVDPGEHTLTVSVPGLPPQSRRVIARVGEHLKLVTFDFGKAAEASTSPPPPSSEATSVRTRPIPVGAVVATGAGVASLAASVVLYSLGYSDKIHLEHTCAPYCSTQDVDQVHAKYVAGDVTLVVGALATAGGVAWYLARPTVAKPGPAIAVTAAGPYLSLSGKF